MPDLKIKVNTDITFDPADHVYYVDGVRIISVTQVLQALNLVDFSKVNKKVLEFAQKRGTEVHAGVAILLEGLEIRPDTIDDEVAPYLESFKLWHKVNPGIKVEYIETPMVNLDQGYAGTPDLIGTWNGELCVIDWKTGVSNPAIRLAQRLQTSAYEKFLGDVEGVRRLIVNLKQDGSMAEMVEYENPQDKYLWDSAIAIYHAKGTK